LRDRRDGQAGAVGVLAPRRRAHVRVDTARALRRRDHRTRCQAARLRQTSSRARGAPGRVAWDLDLKTVEILSIGDELLRGIVQESNSHWLAKRIAARGATLRRVQVLPDEPPVIAAEIAA